MSREAFRFRDPVSARTAAVDSPRVPSRRHRRGNEDWRIEPCRRCKSLVMLWWRFCPFCGTHLPTVLDGKVVTESRRVRQARNRPITRKK